MMLLLCAAAWASPVEVRILEHGNARPVVDASVTRPDGAVDEVGPDGRLTLDLPDGVEHMLIVASPDHLPLTILLTPPLDKPLRVYLRPVSGVGEIVVEAFRATSDLSRHHVDAEMAYETPGTYDDAIRLVQALPGVAVQREFSPSSGDLAVRGSLPGDSRFYYDGIEVPYLYHFNQYASVFPASQLDDLELLPSTFGARYGDATGAIVEARSKEGRPEDVTGSVGLNMVTVGAELRAPLPRRWWMGVAARRSFHDVLGDTSAQYPLWPVFYDFSVRAEHEGDKAAVSVFTAGAGDRYERAVGELDVLDPVDAGRAPTLDYGRDWQMLGVRWRSDLGRITAAMVHDDLRAEVAGAGSQRQRTLTLPIRADLRIPTGRQLSWEAGAELRPELLWMQASDAGSAGPLVSREAPAMSWGQEVDVTVPRLRAGAYATLNAPLGPVRLMPGLRVSVDSAGWVPTFEPRFGARFRVAPTTEIRLATGRYLQRPDTPQVAAFPDLPTTDGWQVGLGVDQAIAGRLEIGLDGYYKTLRNPILQPVSGPPQVFSTGEAFGSELTLRYRLRETFFLWGWLAYGRSFVRAEGQPEVAIAGPSDQPFSGGVVVSWNILPQLNVAVRYRAASGLPFTNIDGSTYNATEDAWIPSYEALNSDRLPFYHKIDLHIAYTFRMRRWSLQLAADVWIVPKSSAQIYPTWNFDHTEQGWVIGPTVVPLVGMRATF